MKYYSLTVLCVLILSGTVPVFAASDNLLEFQKSNVPVSNTLPQQKKSQSGIFSLTPILDNFLNIQGQDENEGLDESEKQRAAFVNATKKFNQGNVVVAYDDCSTLLEELNSNYALLVYAKSMYEIGFFSLGTKVLRKLSIKTF